MGREALWQVLLKQLILRLHQRICGRVNSRIASKLQGASRITTSVGLNFRKNLPSELPSYESLLQELTKTRQFTEVLRSGERTVDGVPDVLVLKTTVERFTLGSETMRAVTIVLEPRN